MKTDFGIEKKIMIDLLPYTKEFHSDILGITIRSWEPVFPLFEEDIPDYVYQSFYPDGWQARQLADVTSMCEDRETDIWIAQVNGRSAGYIGLRVHPEDSMGEIYIIAVDPYFQRQGIGRHLLNHAFEWMRKKDLNMAFVETGDDRGHAPARASYESMGFERYPVARYFKRL